jgi:hypothetical protein
MKSGSGEDPFADVGSDSEETTEETGTESEQDEPVKTETAVEEEAETGTGESRTASAQTTVNSSGLPWKYARENVKDGRDMVQFYLQADTKALESQAVADLEAQLDETVLTFDLREAAYQVALQQHLDDVADKLREWGYDVE